VRRRSNMRPTSPQQAIGSATPTSSADHLLQHSRPRAYQTPGLNSLLDESSEARQPIANRYSEKLIYERFPIAIHQNLPEAIFVNQAAISVCSSIT